MLRSKSCSDPPHDRLLWHSNFMPSCWSIIATPGSNTSQFIWAKQLKMPIVTTIDTCLTILTRGKWSHSGPQFPWRPAGLARFEHRPYPAWQEKFGDSNWNHALTTWFTVRSPPCEIRTSTLLNVQNCIVFYHVVSHAWFYMGNWGLHCFLQYKLHVRFLPNYFDFFKTRAFFLTSPDFGQWHQVCHRRNIVCLFQSKCASQGSCGIPWVYFPCVFSSKMSLGFTSGHVMRPTPPDFRVFCQGKHASQQPFQIPCVFQVKHIFGSMWLYIYHVNKHHP